MARDARWVIKTTFEQLREETPKDGNQTAMLVPLDAIEKRLTFNLDLAGVKQTPGRKAKIEAE